MKKGDIVYFREEYVANYCKVGGSGSYQYYFKPGVRYKVVADAVIQNLEDDITHFAHSTIQSKLITQDEWRDLCINKFIENIQNIIID